MNEENKKRAVVAIETAIKLMAMSFMSDNFLRFVSDVEMDPSPARLEQIEQWNADMAAYLAKRAEQSRQPAPQLSQPQQNEFASSNTTTTFLN